VGRLPAQGAAAHAGHHPGADPDAVARLHDGEERDLVGEQQAGLQGERPPAGGGVIELGDREHVQLGHQRVLDA
jgi:hypothetical protein